MSTSLIIYTLREGLNYSLPNNETIATFISGGFYGVFLLGLALTILIQRIFHYKKYLLLTYLQALLIGTLISCELANCSYTDGSLLLNFAQTIVIMDGLLLLVLLASIFFPFSYKRKFLKLESKIYTAISFMALLYFIQNQRVFTKDYFFQNTIVFLFFAITLYVIYRLNSRNRFIIYPVLLLFTTLCFMPYDAFPRFTSSTYILLKAIGFAICLLNLILYYTFLKNIENQNQRNRSSIFQYTMLVKNYHKLLINEKQINQVQAEKQIEETHQQRNTKLCTDLKKIYKLTEREVEVINLIWDGKTNKEISDILNITLSTTKFHIGNIYIKLNVNSRTQVFMLRDPGNVVT